MNRILPLILVLILASSQLFAQTPTLYNLSFLDGRNVSGQFCVDFYMSYDQAAKLGSSNLYFTYDNTNLSAPTVTTPTIGIPFYDVTSITTPADGVASINLVLNVKDFGEGISTTPTLLGTVCFNANNLGANIMLDWVTTGTYRSVVFLDDQSTLLDAGTMTNWAGGVALPVEWLGFTAEQEGGDAILDWETASEINNKEFQIERSIDGQTFELIGSREGKGNTNGISRYNYVDRGASALGFRKLFYRLRQVDFDGSFEYSPTVELGISTDRSLSITGFPNPFSQELNIRYSSIIKQDLQIEVLSALGQRLYSHNTQEADGDLIIDTAKWAEGIYYISIVGGSTREVYKIVKE